ncbi:MAG: NADH:ubiquinone reductase (Na(+)-transporting) subunit C [Muribaculaceae bacterium]|nr:NADH:ubiquinone reductase (Na(+)-transporting) subunit C [Muribaculaceae bacterium]
MNRQSNTYTIIYSTVLVIVVGVVLSLVYQALRPQQLDNIANDTKRQILASARIVPQSGQTIADLYSSHIKDSYIVNSEGEKIDSDTDPFDVNVSLQIKKPADERLLPVFECDTDNGLKYIVPVYGAGLWGPIWGYLAFDSNGDTIYGAYFAHQGETPGLGAEIEKPAFSDQFEGKDIFSPSGEFMSVAVVKTGKEPAGQAWVHAVSGGTITSQGVQAMLYNSLEPYSAFFLKLKGDAKKDIADASDSKPNENAKATNEVELNEIEP